MELKQRVVAGIGAGILTVLSFSGCDSLYNSDCQWTPRYNSHEIKQTDFSMSEYKDSYMKRAEALKYIKNSEEIIYHSKDCPKCLRREINEAEISDREYVLYTLGFIDGIKLVLKEED